jgi:hypothetical protein
MIKNLLIYEGHKKHENVTLLARVALIINECIET